jgi:hypothetical protein
VAPAVAAAIAMPALGAAGESTPDEAPTCDGERATIIAVEPGTTVVGTGRADVIVAGDGDNRIEAGGGADVVCGGRGEDYLLGGTESDRLFGQSGADELAAASGKDFVDGGAGADWCHDGEEERRCSGELPLDVVPGGTPIIGADRGKLFRYVVIVERGIAEDDLRIAATIDEILGHRRGWTASGALRVKRVDDLAKARAQVYLATPETVDELCYPLNTRGLVSCNQGERVVLNVLRWRTAFDGWPTSIANYRRYLVNHEFGHRLDRAHEPCSVPGEKAAVMQAQTFDLQGCRPGFWPLPFELDELSEEL